ncbi:MAG: hypothetical protein PHV34_23805 [Verrucomicrobiae bacterium]|nr:hypothetical protein [Verrucomicrobiae bacterium]
MNLAFLWAGFFDYGLTSGNHLVLLAHNTSLSNDTGGRFNQVGIGNISAFEGIGFKNLYLIINEDNLKVKWIG